MKKKKRGSVLSDCPQDSACLSKALLLIPIPIVAAAQAHAVEGQRIR